MKKKTARLIEMDKKHVWHPFTQMKEWGESTPVVIERGEGNCLIDTEGRKYLDAVSSLWVTVHGHRKPAIDRAVKAQLDRIAHSTLLGLGNAPSIVLARMLVDIAPKGLSRVFYSDNGSTAVEIALKLAFQYWEQSAQNNSRRKFVAFTGAYHGDTFGSMSVGEIDIFVDKYRPLLFDVYRAPYPYCYRCPMGKPGVESCALECLSELEGILKKHGPEIAACVIEPMIEGASGMITSPPGFLKGVRALTKRYGVLLIADEVATGFGRTGAMFACDRENAAPDILCLAKGLTGGYMPLAATLTTEKIYEAFLGDYDEFRAFFHGHTYTGNPLGCAAAIANIEVFRKERTIEKIQPKIRLLKKLLEGFKVIEHVGDIRQQGLMVGVELVKSRATKEPFHPRERVGHRVAMEARAMGVMIRPLGDTVVIMPPLSIRASEIRKITGAVYDCIKKVTG